VNELLKVRSSNITAWGAPVDFSVGKIYSSIDFKKKEFLSGEANTGISNFLYYQKFPGFKWPAWITEASGISKKGYFRTVTVPFLINNTLREWQNFTNYFSPDSLYVNSCGMISGPGDAPWSVEFYLLNRGELNFLNQEPATITGEIDPSSGLINFTLTSDNFLFKESITGSRSNIDEAIVNLSADIKKNAGEAVFFIVIRPYNNTRIGNVLSISLEPSDLLVRINDKNHLSLKTKPDFIYTGNGRDGDINFSGQENRNGVYCNEGMATLALGYKVNSGKFNTHLRVALDRNGNLEPGRVNYNSAAEDFKKFAELRLNKGALLKAPDEELNRLFSLSGLSLLKKSPNYDFSSVDSYRKCFFHITALNMAGFDSEADIILNELVSSLKLNRKKTEFDDAVKGAYVVKAYTGYYLHKRDMEFLQKNFPVLKGIGDYIYKYCSNVHGINEIDRTTLHHIFISRPDSHDFIILASAMIDMSYLSRCMGIFGDETRYKNESDRLQAVLRDRYRNIIARDSSDEDEFYGLLALPDRGLTGVKDDEYNSLLSCIYNNSNFPVFNRILGVDNNATSILLNQLLILNNSLFTGFRGEFFSLTSGLFLTPEFIDPVTGYGCNGEGNSVITSSAYYMIIRNMFFIDRKDRLEIFPVPEKGWFVPGEKIIVEAAPSRFGIISFYVESGERDIKFIFNDPPKYLPPDIMINIPFNASIIEGDDFIVKKYTSTSFIINGWPSVARFKHSHNF
jgi:hypothetical protein